MYQRKISKEKIYEEQLKSKNICTNFTPFLLEKSQWNTCVLYKYLYLIFAVHEDKRNKL